MRALVPECITAWILHCQLETAAKTDVFLLLLFSVFSRNLVSGARAIACQCILTDVSDASVNLFSAFPSFAVSSLISQRMIATARAWQGGTPPRLAVRAASASRRLFPAARLVQLRVHLAKRTLAASNGNAPQSTAELIARAFKEGAVGKVRVNQRALIDKVRACSITGDDCSAQMLARYSSDHVVFREILTNADDSGAASAIISFTMDKDSRISEITISNDGRLFESADWERLTSIAEGNPDETSIGVFGVGELSHVVILPQGLCVVSNIRFLQRFRFE